MGQDLSTTYMVEDGRNNKAGENMGKGKNKVAERHEPKTQLQVMVGETTRTVAALLSQAKGLQNLRAQDSKGEQSQ